MAFKKIVIYLGLVVVGVNKLAPDREPLAAPVWVPGGIPNLTVDRHIGGAIIRIDRAGVLGKTKRRQSRISSDCRRDSHGMNPVTNRFGLYS
jgi:hypothetical protein